MSNRQNSNGQSETHLDQCRGAWTPMEILDLFRDGTLNSTEMVLLLSIDLLVRVKGKGCFASNEWLGKERMGGLRADTISKMISKLKKLGLVIEVGYDGRKRYLETCWSRIQNSNTKRGRTRSTIERPSDLNPTSTSDLNPTSNLRIGELSYSDKVKIPTEYKEKSKKRKYSTNTGNPDGFSNLGKGRKYSTVQKRDGSKSEMIAKAIENKKASANSNFHGKATDIIQEVVKYVTGEALPKTKLQEVRYRLWLLTEERKVDRQLVREVLLWYKKVKLDQLPGKEYVPDLFSGKDVSTKWKRLAAAYHRCKPAQQIVSSQQWWMTPFAKLSFAEQNKSQDRIEEAQQKIFDHWQYEDEDRIARSRFPASKEINQLAVKLGYPGYDSKYWPCSSDFEGSTYAD